MRYLRTYENIDIKFRQEGQFLKCEQHKSELNVIQVFTIPEGNQEHFGFIVFTKTGEMLFEIRGNQSSRNLTQEQIKELSQFMDYFKFRRETKKYNL